LNSSTPQHCPSEMLLGTPQTEAFLIQDGSVWGSALNSFNDPLTTP